MKPLRYAVAALALPVLLGCPGEGAKKRMDDKIAAQQKKLEGAKVEKRAKEAAAAAPPALPPVQLESYWDNPEYTVLQADGPCPEGFWALFPGEAPGANKEEKKANNAKRAALAKSLREKTYLVKLKGPGQVTLLPFDPPKGHFPLEVLGTIDCTDAAGHVAIAWTPAKAGTPPNSAAKQDADVTQNIWNAEAMKFTLPSMTMVEAKDYADKYKGAFAARIVLKLGKAAVDKKVIRTQKVQDKEITIGGGMEDWGAGRMIHADIQGYRIAVDREQKMVLEKKGP